MTPICGLYHLYLCQIIVLFTFLANVLPYENRNVYVTYKNECPKKCFAESYFTDFELSQMPDIPYLLKRAVRESSVTH